MKRHTRLFQCIQAASCVLVACIVLLTFTAFTISGTVKDLDGNGIVKTIGLVNGSSGDPLGSKSTDANGGFAFDGLAGGDYELHVEGLGEYFPVQLLDEDVGNIVITYPFSNKKSTPTPAPASPPASGGSGQVKYAQKSYNMAPVIQLNLSWKRASKLEPITFDIGSTYDPDGYIIAYEWTFGDGSMGEGKTIEHSYRDEGRYTVKLRVVDNSGGERSAYLTAIISNKPPVAVPGNDTNATVGEPVQFNGTGSYDPDGKVVKYEWSFGDGTTGQGASVSHAYDRPDKYKAELKVTDDSGDNATAYQAVDVTGRPAALPQAKSGSPEGIVLLAGAGVACLALVVMMRKRG